MLLMELYDKPIKGYQDVEQDNSSVRYREQRKTRLTLRQLRKLRRMIEVRNFEKAKNLKKIQDQYGPKAQPGPTI